MFCYLFIYRICKPKTNCKICHNDFSTNKTFVISDSFLMFRYSFYCLNDNLMDHTLKISSINQYHLKQIKFTVETCELGKNINQKYQEVIEKFEKT